MLTAKILPLTDPRGLNLTFPEVRTINADGERQSCFPLGSDISFEMSFSVPPLEKLRAPVMGVVISHATFGTACGVNTRMTNFEADTGPYTTATMRCTIKRFPFLQGRYTVDIWLGDGVADLDVIQGYLTFDIEDADVYGSGKVPFNTMGIVFVEPKWQIVKI